MKEFAENIEDGRGLFGDGRPMCINTYNHESALSQVIQYVFWEGDDGSWVNLQIHGGCDVRGGYTGPRIFSVYNPEYFISGDRELRAGCTGDSFHHWYSDDAGFHWYEGGSSGGDNLEDFQTRHVSEVSKAQAGILAFDPDEVKLFCPKCEGLNELRFSGCTEF